MLALYCWLWYILRMDIKNYKSNNNVVFSSKYHVVWCPKYRRSVLVEVDPQFGIHRLVKYLKGISSHNLRKEFPTLKSRLPTLWTNSYFVSTVGGAPLQVIKQYVEQQKDV